METKKISFYGDRENQETEKSVYMETEKSVYMKTEKSVSMETEKERKNHCSKLSNCTGLNTCIYL